MQLDPKTCQRFKKRKICSLKQAESEIYYYFLFTVYCGAFAICNVTICKTFSVCQFDELNLLFYFGVMLLSRNAHYYEYQSPEDDVVAQELSCNI